jgi:uncharacterized protein (UPF0335 family)
MSDFVNKVVTIILIFVLLVLAPLLISYMSTDMVTERLVLNEVTQFIDRVTDKGEITDADINDIYLGVNSHGGTYDVKVERYIRVATEDPKNNGRVKTVYYNTDHIGDLNVGDVVKVHVKEIGVSNSKRLMWQLLRIDKGSFEFSLAGTVR